MVGWLHGYVVVSLFVCCFCVLCSVSACSVLFCLVVCFSRLVPKSTNIGADWRQNRSKMVKNLAEMEPWAPKGRFFELLGSFLARKNWNPKSRPSLDASDHSVSVILGAFLAENGRPGSDIGSQVGRQVSQKCQFLIKKCPKIYKKLIQEGFHKKRGKIMEK